MSAAKAGSKPIVRSRGNCGAIFVDDVAIHLIGADRGARRLEEQPAIAIQRQREAVGLLALPQHVGRAASRTERRRSHNRASAVVVAPVSSVMLARVVSSAGNGIFTVTTNDDIVDATAPCPGRRCSRSPRAPHSTSVGFFAVVPPFDREPRGRLIRPDVASDSAENRFAFVVRSRLRALPSRGRPLESSRRSQD